jgi:(p)ppGpp synthase/HD superfamily hydrolase
VFGVAGLVLEDGGSEDEAIAALLHDAIEDRPRRGLHDQIAADFGESVLAIVEAVSQEKKSAEQRGDRDLARDSWRERKQRYIDHLEDADPSALRVSLADKLWNLGSVLRDYDDVGHAVWNRFNADRHDQLWYYEELAQRYRGRIESPMVCELSRAVDRLRAIVEGERTV